MQRGFNNQECCKCFVFLFECSPGAVTSVLTIYWVCRCAEWCWLLPNVLWCCRRVFPQQLMFVPVPSLLPATQSVSAALSFVLVGVWTVLCSAAILGLFIVEHVSLTRKNIPAALPARGREGAGAWGDPGSLWEQLCHLLPARDAVGAVCPTLPCYRAGLSSWRFTLRLLL